MLWPDNGRLIRGMMTEVFPHDDDDSACVLMSMPGRGMLFLRRCGESRVANYPTDWLQARVY